EEKQLISIFKALDQNPQLLLLDESFTFLSLERTLYMIDLLKSIRKKTDCSIMFVSHYMPLVKRLADKILILRNGKMVFFGECQKLDEKEIVKYIRGEE
ncbi:MAG: hypothetical protein RMI79_07270, partial [Nitrososphaerota archaeon]|nr:hypothetical protein [Nitrososphaerota archaeon]